MRREACEPCARGHLDALSQIFPPLGKVQGFLLGPARSAEEPQHPSPVAVLETTGQELDRIGVSTARTRRHGHDGQEVVLGGNDGRGDVREQNGASSPALELEPRQKLACLSRMGEEGAI